MSCGTVGSNPTLSARMFRLVIFRGAFYIICVNEVIVLLIADVYINIPVKKISGSFGYLLPDALAFVEAGWRVLVPFGKGNTQYEGFVEAVNERDPSYLAELGYELKEIIAAADEEAWFPPALVTAAKQLADFYLCSPGEIMRLFMPGKSGLKITKLYRATENGHKALPSLSAEAKEVYLFLFAKGAQKFSFLAKIFSDTEESKLKKALGELEKNNCVEKFYDHRSRVGAIYEKFFEAAESVTGELLNALRRKPAQAKIMELLAGGGKTAGELKAAGISGATLAAIAKTELVRVTRRRLIRNSYAGSSAVSANFSPTPEQAAALEKLTAALDRRTYGGFLLYGVTGSGKTFVYMEAAAKTIAAGRRVLVLVPEIALTGQVVESFKGRFGDAIVVIHSNLSVAERNDAIYRVRLRGADIIIGARSALFTPADDLGLIIMDEEQDGSYKQDESPRYHAKVVAKKLAETYGAVLLLGSATPSLESYHYAQTGELTLLKLSKRVGERPLPTVNFVDMREEFHFGNRHIISRALRDLISQTLAAKEQMIIMLNRRGYSTFVMCRSCGEVLKCAECTLPLTYHQDRRGDRRLLCHHCDLMVPIPDVCPACGSRYIKYFGSGTEKLELELAETFPAAKVLRMDRDTTKGKLAHQEILNKFRNENYDILLGTQMVAKGHDIPGVTAVGILSSDSGLNLPDFRAAERTFMLITQTAGRAGRGEKPGTVLVQCYNPSHYAVKNGLRQDYDGFYAEEIEYRRQLCYPPFSRLIKLTFQHDKEETARELAENFIDKFRRAFEGGSLPVILGPSPAIISRWQNKYRFVALIKAADLAPVCGFLREENLHLDENAIIDIDPLNTI